MIKDNLFQKIENKTNVKKETILSLAKKLQQNNMYDETTIKEIIQELCTITGKNITPEKEEKIVNAIKKNQIPKNIEKIL